MRTARELMLGYIAGTAEQSGALFANNGTLELPCLASIGLPPVLEVKQQFFGHLEARGDKIARLREAIDVVVAAEAIYPNGLADVLAKRSE